MIHAPFKLPDIIETHTYEEDERVWWEKLLRRPPRMVERSVTSFHIGEFAIDLSNKESDE